MTAEAKVSKNHYRLNGGLNTEINELNFPDGYSRDEANYELLLDGSRRRRKGLDTESGGSAKTVATITSTQAHGSFKWKAVDSDPDVNFIVHQVGGILYFTNDAETISTTYKTFTVTLSQYKVATATTDAAIANKACSFATGRGHLFVTHPLLKPFYCTWDGTTFTENDITILVRDYEDIQDGVGITTEPSGAITADHKYNLRNRGWNDADITTYYTNTSPQVNPAKNAIWYRGYKRTYDGSTAASLINPEDGTRSFDTTKMDAEVFGNSSAAFGSLLINPLDTSFAQTTGNAIYEVTTWSDTNLFSSGEVTLTTASNHTYDGGEEIILDGFSSEYQLLSSGEDRVWNGLNGTFTVATSTTSGTTSLTIEGVTAPSNFDTWISQYASIGEVGGETLAKSSGKTLTVGPAVCEYYAARVWYGGIQDSEWGDTIFFSQIATKPFQYGWCHAKQDPTDENFNSLLPDDGGYVVIPGLGNVVNMITIRNSLIVLADNGVWEVRGNNRQGFSATGYIVRKLSDSEVTSPWGATKVDNDLMYVSTRGIYVIAPNQYTGELESLNVSEQTIQSAWNDIATANQNVAKLCYDEAVRRVYILYGDSVTNVNMYDSALIYDRKTGAWFKYTFTVSTTEGPVDIYTITATDSADSNKKVKWTVMGSATSLKTCDMDQSDFNDYNGSNGPLPFIMFGHDAAGEWQKRRQAPIISVYSKRTETGFTDSGDGWDAVNPSSTTMTAYWDWTDDAVSNKIGSGQEVYRHRRDFVPSGTGDVTGYPVVVTRNKVRGRGQALQLRFEGATDKDSHILGFDVNYKVSRRK